MAAPKKLRNQIDQIAKECIGMRSRLLDRAITAVYNAEMHDLGVKVSQVNVLIAVGKLEPARPGDVALALHLEGSTLSRNADRLRASGYLDLAPGEDGRSRCYVLTEAGRKLIGEAYPRWKVAQKRAAKMLGDGGVDALLDFASRRPFDSEE